MLNFYSNKLQANNVFTSYKIEFVYHILLCSFSSSIKTMTAEMENEWTNANRLGSVRRFTSNRDRRLNWINLNEEQMREREEWANEWADSVNWDQLAEDCCRCEDLRRSLSRKLSLLIVFNFWCELFNLLNSSFVRKPSSNFSSIVLFRVNTFDVYCVVIFYVADVLEKNHFEDWFRSLFEIYSARNSLNNLFRKIQVHMYI